ncbi:MAG TPA: hypothetical protein VGJ39_01910 [Vicinamibacterales bacterium]
MAQVEIEIELVVERAERGVAGIRLIAAEPFREQVADLQMLGFFRGPE